MVWGELDRLGDEGFGCEEAFDDAFEGFVFDVQETRFVEGVWFED